MCIKEIDSFVWVLVRERELFTTFNANCNSCSLFPLSHSQSPPCRRTTFVTRSAATTHAPPTCDFHPQKPCSLALSNTRTKTPFGRTVSRDAMCLGIPDASRWWHCVVHCSQKKREREPTRCGGSDNGCDEKHVAPCSSRKTPTRPTTMCWAFGEISTTRACADVVTSRRCGARAFGNLTLMELRAGTVLYGFVEAYCGVICLGTHRHAASEKATAVSGFEAISGGSCSDSGGLRWRMEVKFL